MLTLRSGTVLVVDDDLLVVRTIEHYLRRWPIAHATTGAQGMDMAKALAKLALIIIDLNLPDSVFNPEDLCGGAFVVVRTMRMDRPEVPLVVCSGHVSPELVNAAHRLDVDYIVKKDYRENLSLLAERLDLAELAGGWAQAGYLLRLRARHQLSKRQLEVAALAIRGLRTAEIARFLRLEPNTVKRHSANLRVKTGHSSLRALAREALGRPVSEVELLPRSGPPEDQSGPEPGGA